MPISTITPPFQGIEWLDRAGRALRKAKENGSRLWPLYKARCAELRAMRKLERRREADLAALKAENAALRARAEEAEREAEIAVRRRTELQEVVDAVQAQNEWGDPNQFGSSTNEENSDVAFSRRRGNR